MKKKFENTLEITYLKLGSINVLPMNFKRHATEEVADSILLRGFIDPIGYNPTTQNAYDGNGRIEALELLHHEWLQDKTKKVPEKIGVDGDDWYVPVVEIPMDEIQEQSAGAALNRLNEMGGYDEGLMLEVLQNLQSKDALTATGYTDQDIKELLKRFPPEKDTPPDNDPDNDLANLNEGEPVESNVKQVALLYNPEQHLEFQTLAMACQEHFGTDNLPDTVLSVLKFAKEQIDFHKEK